MVFLTFTWYPLWFRLRLYLVVYIYIYYIFNWPRLVSDGSGNDMCNGTISEVFKKHHLLLASRSSPAKRIPVVKSAVCLEACAQRRSLPVGVVWLLENSSCKQRDHFAALHLS